jgi:hypothetical protein
MKKKMLPLAVSAAAAVSMSASAQMYVNEGGLGEVLIFPFYSAENGNATNISLVNTTAHGKAVKVRFIEGENSQEVLDFNVYMSPGDHFSMGVTATADGGGQVVTNDKTCTVPQFAPGVPEPFRNTLYVKTDKGGVGAKAYDNTSIERTAVGYVEVIEMGQLTGKGLHYDAKGAVSAKANPMLAAITHDSTGKPANCDLPVSAWSEAAGGVKGTWLAEADTAGLGKGRAYMSTTWVGGGIYGYAGVVNTADATAFGQDGIAIDNAVDAATANAAGGQGGFALHYKPGDTNPDFNDSNLSTSSIVANGGVMTTYDYAPSTVDAVSGLFQTDEIINDYVTDSTIAATTDWVVTMPTKTFYVNNQAKGATRAAAPFWDLWDGQNACEYASLSVTDREESTPAPAPGSAPDFSPAPETGDPEVYDLPLCKEVTVVQFGATSAVKTKDLAVGVSAQLSAADGWASISLDPADLSAAAKLKADATRVLASDQASDLKGLPVVGFAVQTYTNNNVNGSGNVANYAMSNEHKTVVVGS